MLLIGCTRLAAKSYLLGLIEESATHFDHLIVLTASDDIYLRSRCERIGAKFAFIALPPAPAWNADDQTRTFGDVIAAALPAIEWKTDDCWIIFFDPCIYFPTDFRASLDRVSPSLSTAEIYQPLSCQSCTTFSEFQAIAARGEWRSRGRSAGKDGIHLRHSSQCEGLEVSRFNGRHEPVFSPSKLPSVPKALPITVLKLSSAEMFRGGQGEILEIPKLLRSRHESDVRNFLRGVAQFDHESVGIILETSVPASSTFESMRIARRISHASEGSDILAPTGDCRSRSKSFRELESAIRSCSPDFLLLLVEPCAEALLALIPCIVQAIGKPTWIAGWGYGRPSYPDFSLAIEVSAGSPHFRLACGSWAIQLQPLHDPTTIIWPCMPPLPRSPRQIEQAEAGESGLVMYVSDLSSAPRVIEMLALYRSQWQGAIRIVAFRCNDFRLRLAAARFGASFRILDDPASPHPTTDLGIMVQASFVNRGYCSSCLLSAAWVFLMAQSPFKKTILLLPSANVYDVVQIMEAYFPEDSIRVSHRDEGTVLEAVAFRSECPTIQMWEAAAIRWMRGELDAKNHGYSDILRNDSEQTLPSLPHSGSPLLEHHSVWRENVRIRPVLPPLVPVVTATNSTDLETVAQNWQTIDWGARLVVIFVLQSDQQGSSILFSDPPIHLVSIGETLSSEDALLASLEAAASETDAVWIAFVAPYLLPLPGAHLYEPVPPGDVAYVAPGHRFERRLGGSVKRIPRFGEPATLVNRLWFCDALLAYRNENRKPDCLCTFEQFAFAHAARQRRQIWATSLESCGWAA